MTRCIDVGIFAYNEADKVQNVLEELLGQSIFVSAGFDVQVHVLANGCTDDTVSLARRSLDARTGWHVHDLQQSGKSHTWNTFVHQISRREADSLVFCDADIVLPEPGALIGLVQLLHSELGLAAVVSKPVKDIVYTRQKLSRVDRLIASAGGTLSEWKHSICGQLYVMRTKVARGFHLPIGLPVEDGFVRTMITSHVLTAPPDRDRITGDDAYFHVYESERHLGTLLRHQVRIVIGSAINSVLFRVLARSSDDTAAETLQRVAKDPDWLSRTLKAELPQWPYGYVPVHFMVKRLRALKTSKGLKSNLIVLLGCGFDLLVYLIAQLRMARGAGAGFW